MAIERMNVGQELLNVPMGDMIGSMATSIAEAQWDLDKAAMVVTELMSGQRLLRDLETGELINFEGDVVEPLKDTDGQIQRDSYGEPIYDPANGPRTVDSRVYFGYIYEPERDANGDIIYDTITEADGVTQKQVQRMTRAPNRVSMMELGFTPTFYQFVDTIIEVKMAIKMSASETRTRSSSRESSATTTTDSTGYSTSYGWSGSWWRSGYYGRYSYGRTDTKKKDVRTNVSTVDASYSQRYGYSVEGSSLLRTKLVPVPPPAILQDRIRQLIDAERQYLEDVAQRQVAAVQNDQPTTS